MVFQLMAGWGMGQAKVTVTPGTPNVWSMEQAHYLLNRLRASKDELQAKKLGAEDLDPNAVNGLRLDALQTFLGVAASYDQILGVQNKMALERATQDATRRQALLGEADAKRAQMNAAQLESIKLQEQIDLLDAKKAATSDAKEVQALRGQIAVVTARKTAVDSLAAKLETQVTGLTTAAGAGTATGTGGVRRRRATRRRGRHRCPLRQRTTSTS